MTQTSQEPLTTVKKDGKELDVNIKTEKDEYKSVKDLENKRSLLRLARKSKSAMSQK